MLIMFMKYLFSHAFDHKVFIFNLNLILIMLSNHCNSTRVQSDEFMQIKLEKVNNSMLCDLHYGGLGPVINSKQYNSNELFLSL